MTEITAAMVKELRDATSAGMMDCKRALQETDGDFDEAVKLLREKRHGVGREARRPRDERGQGRRDGARRTRRDRRRRLRDRARLERTTTSSPSPRRCSRPSFTNGERRPSRSSKAERVELAAKLGENIQVVGAKRLEARDGEHALVLRARAGEQGRRARATSGGDPQTARSLALHLTFARPTYERRDEVPQELVDAEREILSKLRRGADEAGERAREDRRGDAQQALLRRVGAQRADLVPRGRVDGDRRPVPAGAGDRAARLRLVRRRVGRGRVVPQLSHRPCSSGSC